MENSLISAVLVVEFEHEVGHKVNACLCRETLDDAELAKIAETNDYLML